MRICAVLGDCPVQKGAKLPAGAQDAQSYVGIEEVAVGRLVPCFANPVQGIDGVFARTPAEARALIRASWLLRFTTV